MTFSSQLSNLGSDMTGFPQALSPSLQQPRYYRYYSKRQDPKGKLQILKKSSRLYTV